MSEKLTVMVNGLPGSMGLEVAAACLRRGYNVASVALTGKTKGTCEISAETTEDNKQTVQLIPSNTETTESELRTYIESIRGPLIVVDYTHPSAVNANGELYAKLKIPFVMGTTGGDRTKLYSDTEQAGTYAVIKYKISKFSEKIQIFKFFQRTIFFSLFTLHTSPRKYLRPAHASSSTKPCCVKATPLFCPTVYRHGRNN